MNRPSHCSQDCLIQIPFRLLLSQGKKKKKKRTDTPSLRCCAVCHRPLAACPTSITHLSSSLTSQMGFDTPGDDKFNKEHKLVRVLHASGRNYLLATRFRPGAMREAPRVIQKSSSSLTLAKVSRTQPRALTDVRTHGLSLEMTTTCCFTFPDLSSKLLPRSTSKPPLVRVYLTYRFPFITLILSFISPQCSFLILFFFSFSFIPLCPLCFPSSSS